MIRRYGGITEFLTFIYFHGNHDNEIVLFITLLLYTIIGMQIFLQGHANIIIISSNCHGGVIHLVLSLHRQVKWQLHLEFPVSNADCITSCGYLF
jgi:hypothetical protein